jgi:tetratricopeptide (TPR) repeat protein
MRAWLVVAVVLMSQGAARAEDALERAESSFAQGDYRAAAEQFRASYVESRNIEALARIAECYERLGEAHQAIIFYQKFLASPTPRGKAQKMLEKRRQDIERRIQALEKHGDEGSSAAIPSTQPAQSAQAQQAQAAYRAGEDAYRMGNFLMAAKSFEEAYEATKYPTILFDIAQAYRMQYEVGNHLEHLRKAMTAYSAFINQLPNAKQRDVAKKHLGDLAAEREKREAEASAKIPLKGYDSAPEAIPSQAVSVKVADKKPTYKKWWPWTIVAVGVAAIAVGVGVGLGMPKREDVTTVQFGLGGQ